MSSRRNVASTCRTLALLLSLCALSFVPSVEGQAVYENVDDPIELGITQTHSYALIVYAEDYSIAPHVPYARHDAEIFEKYAMAELGVPNDSRHIVELKNPTLGQFTAGIARFLDLLAADENAKRTVYVYFAGHGIPDEQHNSLALLPVDYDPQNFAVYAIDVNSGILDKLNTLAVHGLVLLDTCFSGLAARSRGQQNIVGGTRLAERPFSTAATPELVVLSAVSEGEVSNPLAQAEHGLFTYFLLSGLRGKAVNEKGDITVASLYDFVHTHVPTEAARNHLNRQTPRILPSFDTITNALEGSTIIDSSRLARGIKEGAYKYCVAYDSFDLVRFGFWDDVFGDEDTAVQRCTEAIQSSGLSTAEKAEAFRHRGIARSDQGDFDRAISDYGEALRLKPGSAEVLASICAFHFYRHTQSGIPNSLEKGLDSCNQAVKADPQYEPAYNNRAMVHLENGDNNLALIDLDRALQLKPTNVLALLNRSHVFAALNEWGRQAEDLAKAISLEPANPSLYRYRAREYYGEGGGYDVNLAIADLTKAIELKPDYVKALIDRGNLWNKKQLSKAIQDFTRALQINPKCADCLYGRAHTYDAMKNNEMARADYDQLVQMDTKFLTNRGWFFLRHGDSAAAIADYSEDVRLQPDPQSRANSLLGRADIYARYVNDLDGAIRDSTEAIRLDPQGRYYSYRAGLFEQKKDYERAIEDYGQAIQFDPSFFNYVHRGDAYKAAGNFKFAISDYRSAQGCFQRAHHDASYEYDQAELKERLDWVQKIGVPE